MRYHSSVWSSSSYQLTLHNDQGEHRDYQIELGQAQLHHPGHPPDAPSILAVHPSGSSYKQWGALSSISGPGAFSGLFGVNMFGYGLSDRWDIGHRKQRISDHVKMIIEATEAANSSSSWHLIGHSMGAGAVLATAATRSELSAKLSAVCVYEPNLFSLLLVGNTREQMALAEGSVFFEQMMAAAASEDWDMWGRLFYKFWFDGKWDSVEEKAKKIQIQKKHKVTRQDR